MFVSHFAFSLSKGEGSRKASTFQNKTKAFQLFKSSHPSTMAGESMTLQAPIHKPAFIDLSRAILCKLEVTVRYVILHCSHARPSPRQVCLTIVVTFSRYAGVAA
jgi:hypothetical protein